MSAVELVVDTNIVSYLFKKSALGLAYERLIGDRCRGVTGSTLAELHRGSAAANWGDRRRGTQCGFLQRAGLVRERLSMGRGARDRASVTR